MHTNQIKRLRTKNIVSLLLVQFWLWQCKSSQFRIFATMIDEAIDQNVEDATYCQQSHAISMLRSFFVQIHCVPWIHIWFAFMHSLNLRICANSIKFMHSFLFHHTLYHLMHQSVRIYWSIHLASPKRSYWGKRRQSHINCTHFLPHFRRIKDWPHHFVVEKHSIWHSGKL